MLNIGIRAHDIENNTVEELVEKLSEKNVQAIQLALLKSIHEFNVTTDSLNVGFARRIGRVFDQKGIDIAVLGCYINMIHPDEEERKKALDFFKDHIRMASAFGALTVGTETGGVFPEIGFTEENYTEKAYQKVLRSVSELVKEAEKNGVIVAIEGGINHPIYSPKMMKRLVDDIRSENMQVILDVVNYLYPDDTSKDTQHKIINESFELYGDRIQVIHAKDFVINDGKIDIVPVGKGEMDYDFLLNKVKEEKPLIPILLESTQEPHLDESLDFVRGHFK